mgnify:CR=1 FL=1
MKKSTVLFAILLMSSALLVAQPQRSVSVNPKDIVELELLTHTEVTEKITSKAMTSVLIITGGTEERGPHNVLGGHTIMSRHRGVEIAQKLGNTLLAPVLPIAVAATGLRENTDQPGGVQMPADVFKGVQLGDDREHGVQRLQGHLRDGRSRRRPAADQGSRRRDGDEAARRRRASTSTTSADFYQKTHDDVDMSCYEHKLPIAGHGAMMETSEMLVRGTGDRDVRAADLQDGSVRSDRPDARAVEGGA